MRKKIPKYQKSEILFYIVSILITIIIFLIIIFLIPKIRIPFFPDTGSPENIALRREARSSSWLSLSNTANQAVDANPVTFWSSDRVLPAHLTAYLDEVNKINQIVLKIDPSWGARTQTIEVLSSLDNENFTQILPPTDYKIATSTIISFDPVDARYVRIVISGNKYSDSAEIAEFEVYAVQPAHWEVKSIDVMKYSKDVVCNPPSGSTIDTMNSQVASSGANFVAISTPYDNPACGSSVRLTNEWISSARDRGLQIWHRHMGLAFEGIYNTPKVKNLDAYTQQIVDYVKNNPDQFRDGDIFTPTPEPDSAGINGVTYCPTTCQFASADEYNSWIQFTQFRVKEAFASIGKKVAVGYYGHSGFIVWGENNPDWQGKSFLTQQTVDAMDGIIAMDTYPETYGGNMIDSLNGAHKKWPNAKLMIGEWGTITPGTTEEKQKRIIDALTASQREYVIGFNYWNLGPAGQEGLLRSDLTQLPIFETLQSFYSE
jgi:hypothetical protein